MVDFDDNSLSIGQRRKHFDLARELRSIGCEAFLDAVRALGVLEFSSFATLTVDELRTPGSGIPRPAVRDPP